MSTNDSRSIFEDENRGSTRPSVRPGFWLGCVYGLVAAVVVPVVVFRLAAPLGTVCDGVATGFAFVVAPAAVHFLLRRRADKRGWTGFGVGQLSGVVVAAFALCAILPLLERPADP